MRGVITALFILAASAATDAWCIDPQQQSARRREPEEQQAPPRSESRAANRTAAAEGAWLLNYSSETAWFSDQTQVVRDGGLVRAWLTTVFAQPLEGGAKYSLELAEYDCRNGRRRSVAGHFYSLTGVALQNVSERPFTYVIPGSYDAATMGVLCSDFAEWGATHFAERVPDGLTVLEAADAIFRSQAPPVSASTLVGRWGESGDCKGTIDLYSNGTFLLAGATNVGRWSLTGSQVVLYGGTETLSVTVDVIDQNHLRATQSDGTQTTLQRC